MTTSSACVRGAMAATRRCLTARRRRADLKAGEPQPIGASMLWSTIENFLKDAVPGFTPRQLTLPGDGHIAILCEKGDYKINFNPSNTDEVEMARQTFNKLRDKGWLAFE